jgi:hypothetical protein
MASVQYRCVSCGGVHEISVRPGGTMLLRCVETGEWAWHDGSRFLPPPASAGTGAANRSRNVAPRRTSSSRTGARAARGRPEPAAKAASRRTAGRKPAAKAGTKRGTRAAAKRRKR